MSLRAAGGKTHAWHLPRPAETGHETGMKIDRLYLHVAIGETRAAAFAGAQAVALFTAPDGLARIPRLGDVLEARLGGAAPGGEGWFVRLDGGADAFLRKRPDGLTEGAAFMAEIASEARCGKLARVRPAGAVSCTQLPPLEAWRARLPGASALTFETGREAREAIAQAFDEALSPSLTLPGGGRLTLTRTRALTAIDIDTAGRTHKSRPGARARAVNLNAVEETARQLALRGLGGLVVLDCVAPLPRALGNELKSAFLQRFRAICLRRAEALAPSPFGLMEMSLAWGERPVGEIYLERDGAPSPLGQLLAGLGRIEAEAEARTSDALVLELPAQALALFDAPGAPYAERLASRYGRRITVRASPRVAIEVF